MSTTVLPDRRTPPASPTVEGHSSRPSSRLLVVAADGREDVRPAMRVAAALAARLDAPARVLAALEPMSASARGDLADPFTEPELQRVATVREAMRRRVRESVGGAAEWPADAVIGEPTRTIVEAAVEHDAELVLVGAGWHDRSARLSGTERGLEVAGAGAAPVLVAGPDADGTFRRAVVAVDFGEAGTRAAMLACRLLSPGGTLSLVHVKEPLEFGGAAGDAWEALCNSQIAELFRRLVGRLRGGAAPADREERVLDGAGARCAGRRDVTIGTVTLIGDPADEVAAYAERVGADLVACGARRDGAVRRTHVGSVAAHLARRAGARLSGCSVLVSPDQVAAVGVDRARAERAPAAQAPHRTTEVLDAAEWRLALDGFWRRNSGRRVAMEVDDPRLGAQPVARGYVLVGASYDPSSRRAELMLGDRSDPSRHATRMMSDVRSMAVLTAPDGRDEALRVAHTDGETLLTFVNAATSG